jgi:trehalose/maltose hydrolase-like predicted phosphorylase
VFWDADVFVLPFFAATQPAFARAMLEYRIRRLPAAQQIAREHRREGARFAWESARSGRDVTPSSARDRAGNLVPIRTGQLEEHIVADVAWAASHYIDWTGDEAFARGPGLSLFVETARYWASRVRFDADGSGHILGVIGPDEYHEPVDDNAFTNVMARWNLRRAANAVERTPDSDRRVAPEETASWRAVADALVDGYDETTGVYEQFAGFRGLEPLLIENVAPRRPIAADILLGRQRVTNAQVIKQADVLMLHHLIPEEVGIESLVPNLRYYEPRTAHGSSLSPGVHASLFARAHDASRALSNLEIASRIDLDDLTGTTAGGLHIATMGALWQAFVFGFAGVRPRGGRLTVDPWLPESWSALEIRVRFRGARVRVRATARDLEVVSDQPTEFEVGGEVFRGMPEGVRFRAGTSRWEVAS